MTIYRAPQRDMRFVLHELLEVEQLAALPGYEEATADLIDQVIEEGAKLAENVLLPINRAGDEAGCVYENGVVRTPAGFKEAYDAVRRRRLDRARGRPRRTAARACPRPSSSWSTRWSARRTCRSAPIPASPAAPITRSRCTPTRSSRRSTCRSSPRAAGAARCA